MTDNPDKTYSIDGGLAVYDGVNSQLRNFKQATSLNQQPVLSDMHLDVFPSVVVGVIPQSTTNIAAAITATQQAKSVDLAINPMTTPIQTPAAPANASIGVADTAAVAANPARRHLVLVNTSANNISLGLAGNAAVLNKGITLLANGGSYEMTAQQGNLYLGAITAIAGGAASNLSIQEDT